MVFDIRTLILLNFIINIINAGTMAIIWYHYRKRFAGISFWLVNMVLHVVGIGFILWRGIIPDFFAVLLSNMLLLVGAIFLLMGLERFVGKRGVQIQNYILMAVYLGLTTYFFALQPNMTRREIIMSAMIIIIYFQIYWLLWMRTSPGLRKITWIVGLVASGYVVASLIRMTLLMTFPLETNDFFKSGFADSMAITAYLSLHICMIIALILMVTRRLLDEIQTQEEKFAKAFHSAPYAIILTRPSDGRILEVNNGFMNLTGYQIAEVIGKTTPEIRFWARDEDRIATLNELSGNNKVHEIETEFRRKSGELITGLFSADLITINNEFCILASISDITQRKQTEAEREQLIGELQIALSQVKRLSGLLPICASCKKIRDDGGYWQDVAVYVRDHSEAEFSHGICPDCMVKLYPEYANKLVK